MYIKKKKLIYFVRETKRNGLVFFCERTREKERERKDERERAKGKRKQQKKKNYKKCRMCANMCPTKLIVIIIRSNVNNELEDYSETG